ncbi:PREDICTED: eukaryotic translation initiation factor 3 subunit M-like [Amphimedon queenslandica]|uniref:Eukaryotic translation initiation factor 3 subunit M n=1 Tax=Amphimedon queenslandica TaxID=400682 RepID=A0A1X7U8L3_AMPQE|nr:PREDICTED: eukaryotic translation initiation factor 3 subunit M-like [Amphimedon queenslandica]|eukprot:XP_003388769.1 PREDICTED: eukaryotic translation initiation factor 3 subunit M-like [Amphimedon queenslandica]
MTEILGPIKSFTAFIDLTEGAQIEELRKLLIENGLIEANEEEDEEKEPLERLISVINLMRNVFEKQDKTIQELESILLSIASLLHIVPKESSAKLLSDLCSTALAGTTPSNARQRLRLLDLLFYQFDVKSRMASVVFWHKLKMSVQYGLGSQLVIDIDKLKKWMVNWSFSIDEKQRAYKLVWELYKTTDKKSISCRALTELVSTYDSDNEENISTLVTELVVMAISDPDRYIFSDLLDIEAVKLQYSEKIYQLLEVFSSGMYGSFLKFCDANPGYLDQLGLEYEHCKHKIQVLTLLSLAEGESEIPFASCLTELQIDIDSFEQLVIDAIRYKLLSARIDHVNEKVIITNCVRRTFGLNEWNLIHDSLLSWKNNISHFRSNLKSFQLLPVGDQKT